MHHHVSSSLTQELKDKCTDQTERQQLCASRDTRDGCSADLHARLTVRGLRATRCEVWGERGGAVPTPQSTQAQAEPRAPLQPAALERREEGKAASRLPPPPQHCERHPEPGGAAQEPTGAAPPAQPWPQPAPRDAPTALPRTTAPSKPRPGLQLPASPAAGDRSRRPRSALPRDAAGPGRARSPAVPDSSPQASRPRCMPGPVVGRPTAPAAHLGAAGALQHLLGEGDHVGAAARHLLGQEPLHRVAEARLGVRRAPRRHLARPTSPRRAPLRRAPGARRVGKAQGPRRAGAWPRRGRLCPGPAPSGLLSPHGLPQDTSDSDIAPGRDTPKLPSAAQYCPGLPSAHQGCPALTRADQGLSAFPGLPSACPALPSASQHSPVLAQCCPVPPSPPRHVEGLPGWGQTPMPHQSAAVLVAPRGDPGGSATPAPPTHHRVLGTDPQDRSGPGRPLARSPPDTAAPWPPGAAMASLPLLPTG